MDPARAQRLRAIFDEAAERPELERSGFVHASCQGDLDLEREVLSLLHSLDFKGEALEVDSATWFSQEAGNAMGNSAHLAPAEASAGTGDRDLHGVVIGDFQLVRLIGRGGIGAVYEAEQISLKRPVAIKLLQSWTASRDARRRFVEESAILARLSHPGIAQVIAAGSRQLDLSGPDKSLAEGLFSEVQSLPWIAMELVDGARTILDACRGQPLSSVLQMFAQVADAVHYGHQQGFIHRDLKPANILVNARGEPKVIDFGIARAIANDPNAAGTREGALLGSPRYMSPEQCDGQATPVDTRSDVYSLAVVLYEAMTGAAPHTTNDQSAVAYMRAICEQPPRDPRTLARTIPTDAAMVVLKGLSKEPDERYQSMVDFAGDLRRVIAREPVLARRRSTVYAAGMFMRRRPVLTALAALAVSGLMAGFVGITLGLSRERAARREADRAAWLANLTAADSSVRVGDGGAAMRRLNAIPPDFRGWEWSYLRAQADTSLQHWDLEESPGASYISPSGRWAMAHFADGRANLYDLRDHRIVARLSDLKVTTTTQWNKEESVAVAATVGAVVLIDASHGEIIRRIALDKADYPLGAAFSPNTRLLAVGMSAPQGIRVYDLSSGAIVFSRKSDGWVYRPCFTPDGSTLVWSDSTTLECVSTQTWASTASIATGRVSRVEPGPVEVSPDGRTVAVICGPFVQLVDLPSKSVRDELRGHAQRVHSARFDRSSERLVTTSVDRTVRVWDNATARPIATMLGHERPTVQASFLGAAGDEGAAIISVDSDSRIRTWSAEGDGPIRRASLLHCKDYVHQLDLVPNEARLRAACFNSVIEIDLRSIRAASDDRLFEAIASCIVPGTDLVLRSLDTGRLVLESRTSGELKWSHMTGPIIEPVPSPDGRLFALVIKGGRIAIIRTDDGSEIGRIQCDDVVSHLPVFSPDGELLLVYSSNGAVRLWNTATCRLESELAPAGERGRGAAFSPDGTLLAYCHALEGVTVCDTRTHIPISRIDGVGGQVWSIAISPDNTRLAVGSQDRITHLYQLPSGDELLQLRDHTGSVMSLAWSPDGRILATGGYDKRVFVYDCKSLPGPAK